MLWNIINMNEIDPIGLLQVNATIITGVLILLTITNLVKKAEGFWMPRSVSGTVLPFIFSSILAVFQYAIVDDSELDFTLMAVGSTVVGFVVLGFVIMKISNPSVWKEK